MVSYSPNVALAPIAGDMVIITTGQSNDMFWGPLAINTPVADCYYLNPFASDDPGQWTLNEGRDTLYRGVSDVSTGYLLPSDTQAYMPALTAGQQRGGSAWTWFMNFFGSTPLISRPAKRLIIAQCGQHGAPASFFMPGKVYHQRVIDVHSWFTARGWKPTYCNIRQGESDAISMYSAATYSSCWHTAVDGWRSVGITMPFIMDISTRSRLDRSGANTAGGNYEYLGTDWAARLNRIKGEQSIRQGTLDTIDPARKIYMGVDCDLILNRLDGCHDTTDTQAMIAYWRYSMLFEHMSAGRITL